MPTAQEIIEYTLRRAGLPPGDLIQLNPHIPTWILQGSLELQHEWLKQAFGDRGYNCTQTAKVFLTRPIDITRILPEHMIQALHQNKWDIQPIRDNLFCIIKPHRDIPPDIRRAIEDYPPFVLTEEKTMLKTLRINTMMYPTNIYQRNVGYCATWLLQTETRDDSARFAQKVGFPQQSKQAQLLAALAIDKREEKTIHKPLQKAIEDAYQKPRKKYLTEEQITRSLGEKGLTPTETQIAIDLAVKQDLIRFCYPASIEKGKPVRCYQRLIVEELKKEEHLQEEQLRKTGYQDGKMRTVKEPP